VAFEDVAVIPSLSVASTTVLSTDGEEVVNPETGSTVSYYEYYCSNSNILALDSAFPLLLPFPEGHAV
jgi:hypothetical protein